MLSVSSLVVLLLFYFLILIVGLVVAKKIKLKNNGLHSEMVVVAGRDLSPVVGIFTMTATIVGGGYINGTAESIATDGLVWTLAPLGILLGLTLGGLVFARRMREKNYLTMLDPFYNRHGRLVVVLVYLATLCGDIFWSASILTALGSSLTVIIELNYNVAIVVSSSITIIYTMIGNMVAVAYTDVIQLLLITLGLVVCMPFVLSSTHTGNIMARKAEWLGTVKPEMYAVWFDLLIAMTLGSIPWQSYFQRVLSVRNACQAQILSLVGTWMAALLVIPPVLLGAAGVTADWSNTTLGKSPMASGQGHMILPFVLKEFTPKPVAILGLGAVSAAVMSSTDGAILGSSSMFIHNIYKYMRKQNVSDWELLMGQRLAIVLIGGLSTLLAIFVSSVYGLFILAADLIFVIIFPQLTTTLLLPQTNAYGAIVGYFVGLILRVGAGETHYLNLPAFIYFPCYSPDLGQLFPFRTFSMLISLATICSVSFISRVIFEKKLLSVDYDVLKCFTVTDNHVYRETSTDENYEIQTIAN